MHVCEGVNMQFATWHHNLCINSQYIQYRPRAIKEKLLTGTETVLDIYFIQRLKDNIWNNFPYCNNGWHHLSEERKIFLCSTKWNTSLILASLILACDSVELVALCKVIFWKTHIDFFQGHENGHPASFLQGHATALSASEQAPGVASSEPTLADIRHGAFMMNDLAIANFYLDLSLLLRIMFIKNILLQISFCTLTLQVNLRIFSTKFEGWCKYILNWRHHAM